MLWSKVLKHKVWLSMQMLLLLLVECEAGIVFYRNFAFLAVFSFKTEMLLGDTDVLLNFILQ